jgi:hypothetical protein
MHMFFLLLNELLNLLVLPLLVLENIGVAIFQWVERIQKILGRIYLSNGSSHVVFLVQNEHAFASYIGVR